MRVLVVEDTREVGEAIVSRLVKLGYAVDWAKTGAEAEEALDIAQYDLVVLDIILPDCDGFVVLKRIRQQGSRVPVLVITARSAVTDRVDALDLGADDYLVKPFDYRELEARTRALLRRGVTGSATNLLTLGNVVLDRSSRAVVVGSAILDLTRREFALLEVLLGHPGRVYAKPELMDQLFGFSADDRSENAVEQVVARLRRKLTRSNANPQVRTLRGVGYQLLQP